MWEVCEMRYHLLNYFLYLMENPKQSKKRVRLAQEMGYDHELVCQEKS